MLDAILSENELFGHLSLINKFHAVTSATAIGEVTGKRYCNALIFNLL